MTASGLFLSFYRFSRKLMPTVRLPFLERRVESTGIFGAAIMGKENANY